MVQLLNRFFFLVLICSFNPMMSQNAEDIYAPPDYKNKKQFEKFQRRRKVIGAWQINQLKEGALVIKLRTNKTLINQLIKAGNTELAETKRLETYFINKNVMAAFKDNFTFCKLYFMYSSANDSLLNGIRKGIFLDSNLTVDPALEMKEKFYLVAEKDHVYNSSIGFVKEDSARKVKETGNASGEQAEAVVKNKYGHQLKKPFPYVCGFGIKAYTFDLAFIKNVPMYYTLEGTKIIHTIDKTQLMDLKNSTNREFKKPPAGSKVLLLEKQFCYEIISSKIKRFEEDIYSYYKGCPKPEMDKIDKEIIPFLY